MSTRAAIAANFASEALADELLDAYRADVLTELEKKLDSRMKLTEHKTVSKDAIRRFLQLEASAARKAAARAAANVEDTPAADAPPPALAADTNRHAHLLHAINAGGHWKSGTVTRWYEANGYPGLDVRQARHDLAVLRDSGALVQHDEAGVRYFTAAREEARRG
ncbi:hypothetical protein [Streptomyces sp. SGAir0924]|uniref:hypothetical protein n=1 Tax=Streptomyces sp. SGAir0924 TaxID=2109593 RepID=UPI0010CD334A|nr:hypothetical protein [Streptomyces sp. SGAir0924]QCR49858.1 hypothetical protein C1N79_26395 [Streptomyces sp. SGAir0924]